MEDKTVCYFTTCNFARCASQLWNGGCDSPKHYGQPQYTLITVSGKFQVLNKMYVVMYLKNTVQSAYQHVWIFMVQILYISIVTSSMNS